MPRIIVIEQLSLKSQSHVSEGTQCIGLLEQRQADKPYQQMPMVWGSVWADCTENNEV